MQTERPKPARQTLLHVDLKDLKAPWSSWCQQRDLTPSEAVRRVLGVVLNSSEVDVPDPAVSSVGKSASEDRKRLEVRLSPEEHIALTQLAARDGMTVPRWLTALVRYQLTRDPQLGEREIEALTRSSQVLLALGRNVNQIARNMNQRQAGDELTLAQIQNLIDLVKSHTEAVAAVLHANPQRWRR